MGKLNGKVAIITGGASGIGAVTVRRFVEEGAKVVIADLQDERGKKLARELGDVAAYVHTDVSSERDVAAVVDEAVRRWGRLDCMFNNAGFGGVDEPLELLPLEGFEHVMNVMLKGVFLGIKHAARVMKPQRSGSIVSTGSLAAIRTGYGPLAYSTAKAGVVHMSACAAMELGEWGIRVNSVCPGGIVTPIMPKEMGLTVEQADEMLGKVSQALTGMGALPRPGHPMDIAASVVFLASDDGSFINGHNLVVDGGAAPGQRYTQSQDGWNQVRQLLGVPTKPVCRPPTP